MTRRVAIHSATEADRRALRLHVESTWGADAVTAHGELIYPALLPGFVALDDGGIVGHVSYRIEGDRCEITSIDATRRQTGIGTALLTAVVDAAGAAGARAVWLTTTNDNLDALRFYQRRGFRLRALRPGAVDRARAELKPELPQIGSYGIPMQDELDLELVVGASEDPRP